MIPLIAKYGSALRLIDWPERCGTVRECVGSVVSSSGPDSLIGERCQIELGTGAQPIDAEVVGLRGGSVLLMPYGDVTGVRIGSRVVANGGFPVVPVGPKLLGRVVDAYGRPIDGGAVPEAVERRPLYRPALNPMHRARIDSEFRTGIKAIDTCLTLGAGQRVGLFAGSGVGKSALMGMIARHSAADVNVIAMIGERGREVRDFIEDNLGAGLTKSVVVVATSEQSPLIRSQAAFTATAIAEYFSDQGLSVALLLDSITRFAMARREIGLAIGEPPTARGYTPSVFSILPRLLERAGRSSHGKGPITGIYTVLVEGDDLNEPISDSVRAILDGHIVLSRDIANRGRYPAIDLLASVSRLFGSLADAEQRESVSRLIQLLAAYADARDAIDLGAYKAGANAVLDRAVERIPRIEEFLRQRTDEMIDPTEARRDLAELIR